MKKNEKLILNVIFHTIEYNDRSEIRDQRSEIRDQRSEIRDQRSEIRDQRSEIRDQRSDQIRVPFIIFSTIADTHLAIS
jgi:uncharacterized coiled-coil DUF342 family protein